MALDASRGGGRFEAWVRHLQAQTAEADNVSDGTAIVEIVRRFAHRTEFTTNLMPGSVGPDWLQVLSEPGWTSTDEVLLTLAAALHTGSRVFRIPATAMLDLDDADLDLVVDAVRRCRQARASSAKAGSGW